MADERTVIEPAPLLLDRYRVEGILGEGAFGTVMRAFDTRLKRPVAIKTLKRSAIVEDREHFRTLIDRFTREAEAGSRVGVHPNLVAVYDLATDAEQTQYLIIEFVPGGTIADKLRDGPLPLADALRMTADIAQGLQAAHDVGIVHRDVKPANIFLAHDGRAQVGDFGIAQIDHLSGRTYASVTHPGTPLYMSPEQTQGAGYLHPTSDQYSVGLVVFEMLTAQPYKHLLSREAEKALEMHPPAVTAFIRRMIAATADDRFPMMADVAKHARALAAALPVTPLDTNSHAPSPARDSDPMNPDARPPSLPPGDPVVPSVPASVSSGYYGTWAGTSFAPVAAPRTLTGHSNSVHSVAFSPDGQTLASGSADGTVRLWRVQNGAPLAILPGHGGWVRAIIFAPDGETLYSGGNDDIIVPHRAQDGAALGTLYAYARGIGGLVCSPDGSLLAAAGYDGTVRLWRTHDGIALGAFASHIGAVNAVAFSPDGTILASAAEDRTVRLWRVSDGTALWTLVGHTRPVTSLAFEPTGEILASGSADRTVRFWRSRDGAALGALVGPTRGVRSVAFSPDGQRLATGADDALIGLWRPSDGTSLGTLAGHARGVSSVAFSPDGHTLASGSSDRTIRLWEIGESSFAR